MKRSAHTPSWEEFGGFCCRSPVHHGLADQIGWGMGSSRKKTPLPCELLENSGFAVLFRKEPIQPTVSGGTMLDETYSPYAYWKLLSVRLRSYACIESYRQSFL